MLILLEGNRRLPKRKKKQLTSISINRKTRALNHCWPEESKVLKQEKISKTPNIDLKLRTYPQAKPLQGFGVYHTSALAPSIAASASGNADCITATLFW